MANWHGNRRNEQFTYTTVGFGDWTEKENYEYMTGGSLELSEDSQLKVTGNFDFKGSTLPPVNDLVRVYYSFIDPNNEFVKIPLATLFMSYSTLKMKESELGITSAGSLTGSSVLKILENDKYGAPYTVKANSNAIWKAQDMIRSRGLRVNYLPSDKVLTADHTFAPGSSYLDMVNWLCGIADYNPCFPDANGIVHLTPKKKKDHIIVSNSVKTYANNSESIMYPEIDNTNSWSDAPNIVKLLYNTDASCIVAEAMNMSGSKASLDKTGNRKNVYFEEIGELANGNIQNGLIEKAKKILKEKSCDVEVTTLSHAYSPRESGEPINLFDVIQVNYSNMEWIGTVSNISISLKPSIKTQTKVKQKLEDGLVIETNTEVIRKNMKINPNA